jgi:spore germination protein YaaH
LKDKLKADKKLLVAANMELTESEAKGFWPIYDDYQKDLETINQAYRQTYRGLRSRLSESLSSTIS